jgi:hypothetical protein
MTPAANSSLVGGSAQTYAPGSARPPLDTGVPASPSGSRPTDEAASCTASSPKASIPNAPEDIWLLDYGSPECCWCDCPDPDFEDHEPVAYVRRDTAEAAIEMWRQFAQETSRLRGVLDAILVTCESERSTVGKVGAIYRLAASAMSTETAKTPKAVEGRSPASAVPQGDAQ